MGETTLISWCDHTWNPVIGCTKVSPACDGCYAENLMDKRYGRVQWGAPGKGAGTRVVTGAHTWNDPLRWHKKALEAGTRPFVFCASLSDVFDNRWEPEWRRRAFARMRETPALVYLLLTKRPQLIVRLSEEAGGLPPNAAIGTTVEDQERADINVPHLLAAKAKLKPAFAFLSCEPLLGPISLEKIELRRHGALPNDLSRTLGDYILPLRGAFSDSSRLDWVITGGETDQGQHKARPSHPAWFRSLRDQCAAAGVPFHHKQNGEWVRERPAAGGDLGGDMRRCVVDIVHRDPHTAAELLRRSFFAGDVYMRKVGKARAGRLLDGVEHNDRPQVPA